MAGCFWKGIIHGKKSKKGQNWHQIVGNRQKSGNNWRVKIKGRHWLRDRLRAVFVFTCPGGRWGSSQAPGPGPSPCCTPAPPPRPGQAQPPGCQPWSSEGSLNRGDSRFKQWNGREIDGELFLKMSIAAKDMDLPMLMWILILKWTQLPV